MSWDGRDTHPLQEIIWNNALFVYVSMYNLLIQRTLCLSDSHMF